MCRVPLSISKGVKYYCYHFTYRFLSKYVHYAADEKSWNFYVMPIDHFLNVLDKGYVGSSVGQVIRPSFAMFNHSCSPNMVRVDRGRWVVAAACAPVPSGQEVVDSYGATYMEEEKEDRVSRLWDSYWFKCTCFACKKRWPTKVCRYPEPCGCMIVSDINIFLNEGNGDEF